MESASSTRTAMLTREKKELEPWANSFYEKAPNFTQSRLSTRSRNQRQPGSSYADRMYQQSMLGSGAYSESAQSRRNLNQSMIGGFDAASSPLLDTIPGEDSPRKKSSVTWLLNAEDDS